MSQSSIPSASGEQQLSAEDQYFALLPLARLMIASGVTPCPEFGLAQFDACALLSAHSAGRLTLQAATLHAVIRVSRGEQFTPTRAIRREMETQARKLFRRSRAVLEANLSTARDNRTHH
jgi:hypothetical protein